VVAAIVGGVVLQELQTVAELQQAVEGEALCVCHAVS